MIIPEFGIKSQRRISNGSVFIAGLGGLGSPVATYLAAAGIGSMSICDRGVVELSNLNRQIIYNEDDIGEDKAEIAAEKLYALNSNISLQITDCELNETNICDRIPAVDLIIDCLDNFETRYTLNQYAVENNIPLLSGGIKENIGQISLFRPPETPCFSCLFKVPPVKEEIGVLGAAAGMIGSIMAMEALKYIGRFGETLLSKLLIIDTDEMIFKKVDVEKDVRCPICNSDKSKDQY